MGVQQLSPKLLSWASDIDENTVIQAQKTSRLPFVEGHVALMADAHLGIGSTVGSVIPTRGAIMPAAIGVDIGCGVSALETDLIASDLPDNLNPLMGQITRAVPAGLGKDHGEAHKNAEKWLKDNRASFSSELTDKQIKTLLNQFGTLGSGNHFFEVCLDERDHVWVMLHSGSRGIGNQLARVHIEGAKKLMAEMFISLEDPDLAYYVQGTEPFENYIADMHACQQYAMDNRKAMMDNAFWTFSDFIKNHGGQVGEVSRINCHHNFTAQEHHHGKNLWITRKGAIKADAGTLGVIPGSMGTCSYVTKGLGNEASFNSSSHGAGRRFSRNKARQEFTVEDLAKAMEGRVWQDRNAKDLLDEIPSAYKDIDRVMKDQEDLVEIVHTLRQIFNYKGTDGGRRR